MHSMVFACAAACLAALSLSSCSAPNAPDDTRTATNTIVQKGVIQERPNSDPTKSAIYTFGPPQLQQFQIQDGAQECHGAAGSVIPPLSTECAASVIVSPLFAFGDVVAALSGASDRDRFSQVDLVGIEQSFVHQSDANTCWAAAIETVRRFHHLSPVSQQQLVGVAQKFCPSLLSQPRGADFYQIIYAITHELKPIDQGQVDAGICNDSTCIIDSLKKGQPVIMLKSGHATIIVGIDFFADPSGTGGYIKHARILDPETDTAQIKTLSNLDLCRADGFLAY